MNADRDIATVLDFWYAPESRAAWFKPCEAFDAEVRRVLAPFHEQAVAGKLDAWQESPEGCLALCILLDQAPRNMFRKTPRAYAYDAQARAVAEHALEMGFDLAFAEDDRRMFLYLPFEHSEQCSDQARCVELCRSRIADPEYLRAAERHREIVERFGRFPHRNAVLGRLTTPEEAAFLREPFSSF
jgi:uncharacterized protein (DUF924 family)